MGAKACKSSTTAPSTSPGAHGALICAALPASPCPSLPGISSYNELMSGSLGAALKEKVPPRPRPLGPERYVQPWGWQSWQVEGASRPLPSPGMRSGPSGCESTVEQEQNVGRGCVCEEETEGRLL